MSTAAPAKKFPILRFSIGQRGTTVSQAAAPRVQRALGGARPAEFTPSPAAPLEVVAVGVTLPKSAREMMARVAIQTMRAAIAADLIGPQEAQSRLASYQAHITSLAADAVIPDVVTFLWGEDPKALEPALIKLNERHDSPLPFWDFARRLATPTKFYEGNPTVTQFCRQGHCAILEATGTIDILTLGVTNPYVYSDMLALIESTLTGSSLHKPVISGVIIPPDDAELVHRNHFLN